ncbi:heavy metal RND transporter [Paramesorhizobium deserti]|uniref:Heavy metal RND transporter n=1 Tax=Paramesorhizobium deserti TaxID=1494590 RepID=A0A135HS00_9HYPH|nr:FixH family protein [Paramesorhizobium deserti]KXF75933.1 heavy metal RND transporter [Paramesorhizobium deserti]
MKFFAMKRTASAVLMGLAVAGLSSNAWAGIQDYEFQLVQPEIEQGNAAVIAVRLVDKRSGEAVPDAVIFAQRVDMAPDGMEMMAAPIEALPSTEPGVYRFKAQISMAGGWRLSLGAKVQGETGTLENKLVFKAVP